MKATRKLDSGGSEIAKHMSQMTLRFEDEVGVQVGSQVWRIRTSVVCPETRKTSITSDQAKRTQLTEHPAVMDGHELDVVSFIWLLSPEPISFCIPPEKIHLLRP